MKISELQPKQSITEITVEVVSMGETREFQKFGDPGRVANAIIKDDSGEMKMTLWNEQIDQIKAGDKLLVKDAFVNEWQNELQLTTGRKGSFEIIK
jgi:replication factor A1